MGTDGMSFSLQSRDLIADSIETVMGGQWYDANISLPGCDKNMPGCLIAMGRLNRPSLMVYGGTIRAGHGENDQKLDVISAFQSYGEFLAGEINEKQRQEIVRHSCPGAGACGGMYTANTMASAIEVLGMSLPYSSSTPAEDPLKLDECRQAGAADPQTARAGSQAARHHDARGVRERDGRGHHARRLDQRRAASDCDGALGRRVADDRRLPARQRSRAAAGRLQAERLLRAWRICTRSAASRP